jgi:hypothetical protein
MNCPQFNPCTSRLEFRDFSGLQAIIAQFIREQLLTVGMAIPSSNKISYLVMRLSQLRARQVCLVDKCSLTDKQFLLLCDKVIMPRQEGMVYR